jgi:hypothetical protein
MLARSKHPLIILLIGLLVLAPLQGSLAGLLSDVPMDCMSHCKHSDDPVDPGFDGKTSHRGCSSQLDFAGECSDCGHCQLVILPGIKFLCAVPAFGFATEIPVYHGIRPLRETPPPQLLQG